MDLVAKQSVKKYSRKRTDEDSKIRKKVLLSKQSPTIGSSTRISKDDIKPKKLRQIYFKTSTNRVTCPDCNMSYAPHLKPDLELHEKFHQRAMNGREWLSSWGHKLYEYRVKVNGKTELGTLYEINVQNKPEVRAAKEMLELVNTELQAPEDCGNWLRGKEFGKVFVYVLNKRAVGIVCLERIQEGEWLILESGNIVPKQKVPLVAGISRIYVARNFRRCHIGSELLSCTRKHFIYGIELKTKDIGWSQPSEFGSKLAFKFNSIKHKTGYNLLPIYVEETNRI